MLFNFEKHFFPHKLMQEIRKDAVSELRFAKIGVRFVRERDEAYNKSNNQNSHRAFKQSSIPIKNQSIKSVHEYNEYKEFANHLER